MHHWIPIDMFCCTKCWKSSFGSCCKTASRLPDAIGATWQCVSRVWLAQSEDGADQDSPEEGTPASPRNKRRVGRPGRKRKQLLPVSPALADRCRYLHASPSIPFDSVPPKRDTYNMHVHLLVAAWQTNASSDLNSWRRRLRLVWDVIRERRPPPSGFACFFFLRVIDLVYVFASNML